VLQLYPQCVTISDSSIRFLCWCVRQVVLHTLIAEPQNTTYIHLMVVSSGAIVRRVSFPRQLAGTKNVRFNEGLSADFHNAKDKPCLIILDDLLNEAYTKDVCDLFTKGSHHRNVSVVLITQILFHQGWYCRDISLNAMYILVFKTCVIRINSTIWRDGYIPKIVTDCSRRI